MVGRGEPGRCERAGGRAGRGHTVSSEPDANSLGACGHAHHGRGRLSTWQSQPPGARGSEAGALWHAWLGCRQRAREGAPREAGLRGGPWAAPPAPCPPRLPTGSAGLGGKGWRCPPRAQPARRPAPTCRVWRGRPLPGHLSFLLLRKPLAQLPACRTGGAGIPGQGARLAVCDT